jgi:hypothetical protein
MTLVDDNGDRLFTEQEVGALAGKSSAALSLVHKVAARLNGIGGDAVEVAVKNSEAAPSGASTSA